MPGIPDTRKKRSQTNWVLLARNPSQLKMPALHSYRVLLMVVSSIRLWPDNYNNLFQILKYKNKGGYADRPC
jgi:hypothetical protein